MIKKNFYLTTPIYYINAKPHIGSLYTTLIADTISRLMKLFGHNTIFLTGTDEHGQKVEEAAKLKNKKTKEFADELVKKFYETWENWNIKYDIFIRTTDEYHIKSVQKWVENLTKKGFIYKGKYEGWYSISSESFILEKDIESKNEKGTPLCPISGKEAIWVSQDAYFFKLSIFEEPLLKFFEENPKFIVPSSERINEIISFIKGGLNDLCISRLKKDLSWGIPYPNDDEHVLYVWADALNNYLTAIGYLQKNKEIEFTETWPCDLHLLGKDIIKFHTIYWLAFLMASELKLPKNELVHGWILVDNKKMSKSLGNVITPKELLNKYHRDVARYYLIRHIPTTQDSTFSYDDLEERNNSELADSLGNLLQRLIVLSIKNNLNEIKYREELNIKNSSLYKELLLLIESIKKDLESYSLHKIYTSIWKYISLINAYLHESQPWKIKDNKDEFEKIISICFQSLYSVAILIWPVMPEKSLQILSKMGFENNSNETPDFIKNLSLWNKSFKLKELEKPLFIKFEKTMEEIKKEEKQEIINNNFIDFDTFKKIELRVGEILEIREIIKSDKLYSLTVDFGEFGQKNILSGIKKYYKPEELKNIKVAFVFNLEPRSMLSEKSEGMILTTKTDSNMPLIVKIDNSIKNGTILS
jgi:methionyl-tRNA synthetase